MNKIWSAIWVIKKIIAYYDNSWWLHRTVIIFVDKNKQLVLQWLNKLQKTITNINFHVYHLLYLECFIYCMPA